MAKKRAPRSSGKGGGPSTSPAAGAFFSMLEPKKKVRGGSSAVSGEVLAHVDASLSTAAPTTTPTTDTTMGTMASDPPKPDLRKILAKIRADAGATEPASATPAAAPVDTSAVDALAARLVGGAPVAPAAPAAPEPTSPDVASRSAFGQRALEQAENFERLSAHISLAVRGDPDGLEKVFNDPAFNAFTDQIRSHIIVDALKKVPDELAVRRFISRNIPPEDQEKIVREAQLFYGADDPIFKTFSTVAALPTTPAAPSVSAAAAKAAAKAPSLPSTMRPSASASAPVVPPPLPPATPPAPIHEPARVIGNLRDLPQRKTPEEMLEKKVNRALDLASRGGVENEALLRALLANPGERRDVIDAARDRWLHGTSSEDFERSDAAYKFYKRIQDIDLQVQEALGMTDQHAVRILPPEEVERKARESALKTALDDHDLLQRLLAEGKFTPAEVHAAIDARSDLNPAQAALLRATVDAAEAAATLPPGVPEQGNIRKFLEKLRDWRWRVAMGVVGGVLGGTGVGLFFFGAGGATLLTMAAVAGARGGAGGLAAWLGTEKIAPLKNWLERKSEQSRIKGVLLRMAVGLGFGALAGGAVSFSLSQAATGLGFATSGPSGKVGPIVDRPRPGNVYPPTKTIVPETLEPTPPPRISPIPHGDTPPDPRIAPAPSDTVPAPDSTPSKPMPGADGTPTAPPQGKLPVAPAPEPVPINSTGTSLVIAPGESAWLNIRTFLNSAEGGFFFQRAGMSFALQEQFLKAIERALVADPTLLQGTGIRRMVPIGNGMYNWLTYDNESVNLSKLLGNPRLLDAALDPNALAKSGFRGLLGRLNVLGITDFKNALLSRYRVA